MTRVACIGDSITWGFTLLAPWRDSYPALLGRRLGERLGALRCGHPVRQETRLQGEPRVEPRYRPYHAREQRHQETQLGPRGLPEGLPRPRGVLQGAPITTQGHPHSPHPDLQDWRHPPHGPLPGDHGGRGTSGMGLELIDLRDLFTDTHYMLDGVHPQRAGTEKLEEAIYSGIKW